MEAMSWSEVQYKQAYLPTLRITDDISRRDSITSSKTGDSGYNSDPDISLSPLDFKRQDQLLINPGHLSEASVLPSLTFEYVDFDTPSVAKTARVRKGAYGSILLKRYGEGQKAASAIKFEVTSNPSAAPPGVQKAEKKLERKPDWTKAFKNPFAALGSNTLENGYLGDTTRSSRKEEVETWIDESIPSHNRPKERVSSIVSLSSTGSADMYTNTDASEDEELLDTGSSTLSKATRKTIELIMRKIEVNLGYVAYMQCAGGQSSRNYSGTGETSRSGRGSTQGSGGKRKSRPDDRSPSENPDDDGSNKRRRVSITTTEDSEAGPRFACPFFKHDPNRYRNRRTCGGPGWPTVHRMKEHLYRAHAQPIFCPRCYTMFDSDNEFSTHLRSNPCQISVPQPIEGIDRETLIRLRKRSPALRLEEDKWRDTYQLLFPDVSMADIPSPYYDSDSPTEESRRFRRELLERIRHELFATAEQETGPVEQNLLRQVAGIIQRCESDLLASLNSARPSQVAPPPNRQSTSAPHIPRTSGIAPSHQTASRTSSRGPPRPPARSPAHAVTPTLRRDSHMQTPMLPTSAQHDAVTAPQYLTASPTQFSTIPWEDPYVSSSEWIDWNLVFEPAPEVQVQPVERTEPFPALSTPVWT